MGKAGFVLFFLSMAAARAQSVPATVVVEDPRTPWRIGAGACVAGGAVALILGAVAYSQGSDDLSAITDAARNADGVVTGITQREALRLQDSADRAHTLGAVGFAAGGALIAVGVALWILEPPPRVEGQRAPDPEVRPFSLLPMFTPDEAGVLATARF